ncbi:MAG: hypothetical protein FWF25_00190 [Propionibacteriaceae bacterium]|nr:hypothetical protein [Propionibacteriaceae bacterium]
MFDDSLLDDPVALLAKGERVRALALTGARIRLEHTDELLDIASHLGGVRPRSVVAIGAEARLIRAVVEPSCPVPCVAWPMTVLPPWAGPLDLVIVLAGADARLLPACVEAHKRGCWLLVVAPQGCPILDESVSMEMLPTHQDDPFVSALLALKVLDLLDLGPGLDLEDTAAALDAVAETCGPRHGLEVNPAKNLACALADVVPLLWGGSVLAARASRRVAEALRDVTGLPVLAADEHALAPLLLKSEPRDLFADPVEGGPDVTRFCLLILDDEEYVPYGVDLARLAESRDVRVETIRCMDGNPVERYASLLHQGLFAAAYLDLATVRE